MSNQSSRLRVESSARATARSVSRSVQRLPRPVELLQRTYGNQGVRRLLAGLPVHGAPSLPVQRMLKFDDWCQQNAWERKDDSEAREAIIAFLGTFYMDKDFALAVSEDERLDQEVAELWARADNNEVRTAEVVQALDAFVDKVNKIAGVESSPNINTPPNTNTAVITPPNTTEVEKKKPERKARVEKQETRSNTRRAPEKKPLSKAEQIRASNNRDEAKAQVRQQLSEHFATVWAHICQGEDRDGTPVGYHWKGLNTNVVIAVGSKTWEDTGLGIYKQWVIVRSAEGTYKIEKDKGKPQKVKSTKQSTFWPDDWTKADIEEVCLSLPGSTTNQTYDVPLQHTASGKNCSGMRVRLNPDSAFPYND